MTNPNVKPGDKRWVWHFDELKEVEVLDTFEYGVLHIEVRGFAYSDFYETRHEAIEHRLRILASRARRLDPKSLSFAEEFEEWQKLARSTELALSGKKTYERDSSHCDASN